MGVLFRKGRQPTQEEIDAVPPPTDEELIRILVASAAGVLVLVGVSCQSVALTCYHQPSPAINLEPNCAKPFLLHVASQLLTLCILC